MPTVDTFTLPRIEAGVSGQAAIDSLNAPIEAAETALNQLSGRIGSLNQKSAVIRHYVPVASGVTAGMLVYYNKDTARFEPAIAALLSDPGSQGESVEAPSARVEGLIISVDGSGITATMLCGGYWESAAVAQACLGSGAQAGTYYLSPFTAGKAVLNTNGHLRQPVLSYYGDGKLSLSLFYMAHDNHFHGSAVLTGSWVSAGDITDVTPPEGAVWVYDADSDAQFKGLGELSSATTAVFYNGTLQRNDIDQGFEVSAGYLWCGLADVPASGTVTVFNHFPFAYDSPVVRGVESVNDGLTVTTRNGLVRLTPNAFVSGSTMRNALAVAAISDNTILYTPVVTAVQQGPGIHITKALDGSAVISASNLIGSPVDATSINHNGTAVTSDGIFQYITFPQGRQSEAAIQLPVADVLNGAGMLATVWATIVGTGAAFSVKMYFIPQPTADASTDMPSSPAVETSMSAGGELGKAVFMETKDYATFSGNGTLVAVVRIMAAPSTDIRMLRIGFRVTAAAAAPDQPNTLLPINITDAIVNQMAAGYPASQYNVVYADSGVLRLCRSDDVTTANRCVGVLLANADVGEVVRYAASGIIQDPAFSWTPGEPVYIGADGTMTQTSPDTAAYIQRIGIALTAAAVQLSIEPAIVNDVPAE